MKIIAVYVTYNPDWHLIERSIQMIVNQVDDVAIIDNSEVDYTNEFERLKSLYNCSYILLKENKGIATALNCGFEYSQKNNADWVLCFDQDSVPPRDMVSKYKEFIVTKKNLGQVGPLYAKNREENVTETDGASLVDSLITSGSLVNVEAYKAVGGFKDKLFIDSVDTEFSWNLKVHGWHSYKLNTIVLQHNLGVGAFDVTIAGKRLITITNHNYIRCYYIARNSLWVGRHYVKTLKEYAGPYRKKWIKLVIKVLFFEKDKLRKLRFIMLGVKDCNRNIFGKCSHI